MPCRQGVHTRLHTHGRQSGFTHEHDPLHLVINLAFLIVPQYSGASWTRKRKLRLGAFIVPRAETRRFHHRCRPGSTCTATLRQLKPGTLNTVFNGFQPAAPYHKSFVATAR